MNKINKIIRQRIFDIFIITKTSWHGNLDDVEFLSRLFDLSSLPSYDSRHKDAEGDIARHRILNPDDWEENWIFSDSRFDLYNCDDKIFLNFLCLTIHPAVRDDSTLALNFKDKFNTLLEEFGYEIYQEDDLLGKPIFNFKKLNDYSQLKIYVQPNYTSESLSLPAKTFYPCLLLVGDNWNDFLRQTLFHAFYFRDSNKKIELGAVKILQKNTKTTVIKSGTETLSADYISLGQSMAFYEGLLQITRKEYELILTSLNDVVFNRNKLTDDFLQDPGWTRSLLRNSEAEKAFNEAGQLLEKQYTNFEEATRFEFMTTVRGFNGPHKIIFDFKKNDLPHRINVLIGKNGAGKTRILANIANSISGFFVNKEDYGSFSPKPNFSKIIAISYSVFDSFEIPESESVFSYSFLGIRTFESHADSEKRERLLTRKELEDKFIRALKDIFKNNQNEVWENIMAELFEVESFRGTDWREFFNQASSGEAILLNIFTNVIANINKQSLLLIDEPELHLHPNAISNFTRMLNKILLQFDSYAIISTHSPIVIQEIPSKYIHVLKKEESIPIVKKLNIESFGENLSVITNEVFETDMGDTNYKDILGQLSRKYTQDQILKLFGGRLGFNAQLYLQAIFDDDHVKS